MDVANFGVINFLAILHGIARACARAEDVYAKKWKGQMVSHFLSSCNSREYSVSSHEERGNMILFGFSQTPFFQAIPVRRNETRCGSSFIDIWINKCVELYENWRTKNSQYKNIASIFERISYDSRFFFSLYLLYACHSTGTRMRDAFKKAHTLWKLRHNDAYCFFIFFFFIKLVVFFLLFQ